MKATITKSGLQNLRTAVNRAARSGHSVEVVTIDGTRAVSDWLAPMERIRRARDAQLGRSIDLDDPARGPFWRATLLEQAALGALDLTTATVDGDLAGYGVTLIDGSTRKFWDTRVDPAWKELSLGWRVVVAALERSLADPGVHEFDLMR